MKGRHFAFPSRPTVAKYCTGFFCKNSTTFCIDKYLLNCFIWFGIDVTLFVTSFKGTISPLCCNVNSYINIFVTFLVTSFKGTQTLHSFLAKYAQKNFRQGCLKLSVFLSLYSMRFSLLFFFHTPRNISLHIRQRHPGKLLFHSFLHLCQSVIQHPVDIPSYRTIRIRILMKME